MNTHTSNHSLPHCPPRWSWHYDRLQSQRDRLLRNCAIQIADVTKPMEPDGMDMADCATDGFEHDMTFSLLSQEQNSLHEIDAALHRILEDKYGICEESGQPIPEARLRAIPWTRYTREAAENLEKKTLTNGPHLGNLASIRRPRFSETLETDETATKPFQPTEVIRHRRQPDYEPSKSETETWTPAITFSQE